MAIDFKHPQTILAIILILAAIAGPIFFRERMLWKLDATQEEVLADMADIKKRLNEAEIKLREREVWFHFWMKKLGEEAGEDHPPKPLYDPH